MKKKFLLGALLVTILSIGISVDAQAGPWRHGGYYHPYHRVIVAPPVVVVRPGWGPRPHYYARPYYGRPRYYAHPRYYGHPYAYRSYYGRRRW